MTLQPQPASGEPPSADPEDLVPEDLVPEDLVPEDLAPEDFYFDGPYMVFTAAYHRKRGYCCNSDCRHCPFR